MIITPEQYTRLANITNEMLGVRRILTSPEHTTWMLSDSLENKFYKLMEEYEAYLRMRFQEITDAII